jgi:hypothetical protein
MAVDLAGSSQFPLSLFQQERVQSQPRVAGSGTQARRRRERHTRLIGARTHEGRHAVCVWTDKLEQHRKRSAFNWVQMDTMEQVGVKDGVDQDLQ